MGANIECSPKNLIDFSIMGSSLFKSLFPEDNAKLALLNIGSEEIKGNEIIKETYQQLNQRNNHDFEFKGYIEGNQLMNGDVNVIVADGFTGNVALKTAEGTAVPSAVLSATLPVKPSATITLTSPFISWLPSIYPLNSKSWLFLWFNCWYVSLIISLPLISSDPIFSRASLALSSGNRDLKSEDPIIEKSIKFFGLHSILAPKSKTTLNPFLLGLIEKD